MSDFLGAWKKSCKKSVKKSKKSASRAAAAGRGSGKWTELARMRGRGWVGGCGRWWWQRAHEPPATKKTMSMTFARVYLLLVGAPDAKSSVRTLFRSITSEFTL